MKRCLVCALVLAGLLTSSAWSAEKSDFLIFVLAGQSNMAGRGKPLAKEDQTPHPRVLTLGQDKTWQPAVDPLHWDKPPVAGVGLGLSFAKAVADALPDKKIGLVPVAFGGSSISQWAHDAKHYVNAIERANLALNDGTLAGILWHQGESDTKPESAGQYQAKLDDLIQRFRSDLVSAEAPFLVGTLAEKSPGSEQVNAALRTVPDRVARTGVVESKGLRLSTDNVHFDAASYREFGKRYAAEWLRLTTLVPLRIGAPVNGHIHPSLCIGKTGTLVVTYGHINHQDLRSTRSTDGGRTWSPPAPFVHTVGKTYYPGSLSTLRSGTMVHCWNRWSTDSNQAEPRSVLYSTSDDDGLSWSEPKAFPRNPDVRSVIRHPLVELSGGQWLVSLDDNTFLWDPATQMSRPFGDGRVHGLVPIVRTPRGTFISGKGFRSTDEGKSWQTIDGFPDVYSQGWRHELICLNNGWLMASEILGPGFGGERIRYRVSRDDGLTWTESFEYYNPRRAINGRACPRTVQLDDHTIGVVFYDIEAKQPGGPGLFFLRIPVAESMLYAGVPQG